jgi:RimJ/RimL family protein N-acetyltransferase
MQISTNGILEGQTIHLVPMEDSHKTELSNVLMSPEIWEFTWRTITTSEEIDHLLTNVLENKSKGSQIPFTIVERASGKIIGTTRIGDIDLNNRNVEIGWTWLSPDFWRTSVNTECKYLLLRYCFEDLKVIRVQFSISGQNLRSQRAVERIGAKKEGVFRKHRIKPDGSIHDNIFYSIIDTEWPNVKENLHYLLARKYS